MKNENIVVVHEVYDVESEDVSDIKPFVVPCDDVEVAKKIMDILGAYDIYLMENYFVKFGGSGDCVLQAEYESGEKVWINSLTDEELEDNTYFERIIDCNYDLEI